MVFALLLIGTSILLGYISVGIEQIILVNLSLSAISAIGLVMAIFIGTGLVSKEIEKRSVNNILSKPVRRAEFIAGKYCGLLVTLAANTGIMTLGFYLAILYQKRSLGAGDWNALRAIYFILLELALVQFLAIRGAGIPTTAMLARPGAGWRSQRPTRWILLALCFLALVPVQRGIDREKESLARIAETVSVPPGEVLRRLTLGYEGLLADIYWTRAVQYFGRQRLARSSRFELLGPLLRVATTLDPHLIIVYRYGAVFLAEKPPAGAGQPEQALELLRRGIVANPDYWRLWQDLGFIYYWDLKDYARAARAFETGGERARGPAREEALDADAGVERLERQAPPDRV